VDGGSTPLGPSVSLGVHCTTTVPGTQSSKLRPHCISSVYSRSPARTYLSTRVFGTLLLEYCTCLLTVPFSVLTFPPGSSVLLLLKYSTCHLTVLFSVLPGATSLLEPSTHCPVVKDKHSTSCISFSKQLCCTFSSTK
jgi:hypothetical protein